ncbi:MAG: hypothetical protein ACLT98_18230 [Eggerthellaceae bacterium]
MTDEELEEYIHKSSHGRARGHGEGFKSRGIDDLSNDEGRDR